MYLRPDSMLSRSADELRLHFFWFGTGQDDLPCRECHCTEKPRQTLGGTHCSCLVVRWWLPVMPRQRSSTAAGQRSASEKTKKQNKNKQTKQIKIRKKIVQFLQWHLLHEMLGGEGMIWTWDVVQKCVYNFFSCQWRGILVGHFEVQEPGNSTTKLKLPARLTLNLQPSLDCFFLYLRVFFCPKTEDHEEECKQIADSVACSVFWERRFSVVVRAPDFESHDLGSSLAAAWHFSACTLRQGTLVRYCYWLILDEWAYWH